MKKNLCLIGVMLILGSCTYQDTGIPLSAIHRKEFISVKAADRTDEFNFNAPVKIESRNGIEGLVTQNKTFFEKVMLPELNEYRDELAKQDDEIIISTLAKYTFKVYQTYFGQGFYRWGGDLFDLDDPQPKGLLYERPYGLDCSGFTTAAYDIAVYMELIPAEKAVFSSKGYKLFCDETGFDDGGSLVGGSNRYRLDTSELYRLGEEVFRIEKNEKPTKEQLSRIKPGDIAGRNGHFGIIVEIEDKLYYLESGGWVVPVVGGYPVEIKHALMKFAKNGYVSVRRCL